jgi:hypothetical protein
MSCLIKYKDILTWDVFVFNQARHISLSWVGRSYSIDTLSNSVIFRYSAEDTGLGYGVK